jgi:hypothetical protein
MRRHGAWWLLVLLGIAAGQAAAQQPGNAINANANPATAVQLPTFSFFSVGTSVLVPDRGSTHLGGIGRASSGSTQFGVPGLGKLPYAGRLFNNRGIGSQVGASNMRVSVQIHDFEAMEEQLLGGSPSSFAARQPAPGQAAALGRVLLPRQPGGAIDWTAAASPQPAMSVDDAREHRAREQLNRRDEASEFLTRAERAEAEGKANVARIYYEMALRRADDDAKDLIAARLGALRSAESPGQLAGTGP